MKSILIAALLLLSAGCITRAPTSYELDRRSGMIPPTQDNVPSDELAQMKTSSTIARAPRVPVKVPPLIEKVWLSDIGLGDGARLQGTWLYLEVEAGRWLDEIDPGGAPLIKSGDLNLKTKSAGE